MSAETVKPPVNEEDNLVVHQFEISAARFL